jgi:hypothetical protein
MNTGRMGIPDEQGAWEAFIERHPLADSQLRVDDMKALEVLRVHAPVDRYPGWRMSSTRMGNSWKGRLRRYGFCPTARSDAVLRARPHSSGAALIDRADFRGGPLPAQQRPWQLLCAFNRASSSPAALSPGGRAPLTAAGAT